MRVLITGGTGFIGRALSLHLRARQNAVTVLTRDIARAQAKLGNDVKFVESLDNLEEPIDVVVNLAGANLADRRWTSARKQELVSSRMGRTAELIDWMKSRATPPRVMVSGSAVGWYGMDRGDTALTETDSPGDDFAAQLCRQWEAEAERAKKLGVRVCILRTGVVLGPRGGALAKMLLPFKLGLGGPIASGQQWMSWISLDDIVRLIAWLIDNDAANGAYNGTAPNPVRNKDFALALGDALHRPALLRAPASVLRLVLGEMAELLVEGQRVIPQRALAEGFDFHHANLASALTAALAV